mmetsp:Transcript_21769/g.65248  ORF Transcript_21769/g.65248 Transcript_21769/m.65248 type:complete len:281 (+) Transcript_21769:18-860(+)
MINYFRPRPRPPPPPEDPPEESPPGRVPYEIMRGHVVPRGTHAALFHYQQRGSKRWKKIGPVDEAAWDKRISDAEERNARPVPAIVDRRGHGQYAFDNLEFHRRSRCKQLPSFIFKDNAAQYPPPQLVITYDRRGYCQRKHSQRKLETDTREWYYRVMHHVYEDTTKPLLGSPSYLEALAKYDRLLGRDTFMPPQPPVGPPPTLSQLRQISGYDRFYGRPTFAKPPNPPAAAREPLSIQAKLRMRQGLPPTPPPPRPRTPSPPPRAPVARTRWWLDPRLS